MKFLIPELLDTIANGAYITQLSFMVYMCKIITSPGFFSFFQNFGFLDCWQGKRTKNGPK